MSWFVPGRIEVLGKHTDYAGGRSLLIATEQGVTATVGDLLGAVPGMIEARSSASPDAVTVVADTLFDLPAGNWGRYLQTVVDRLTLNFGELKSARLEIDSTLPLASGMSSSSALVVAVTLALADYNGLWELPQWSSNIRNRLDLAGYAAAIENGSDFKSLSGSRGVGTSGGSQDHAGMLCSVPDHLTPFTYFPLTKHEAIPVPQGWSFAVAVSGVLAEKTGAALESYNSVSLRVGELVDAWNRAHASQYLTLAEVLNQSEDAAEELGRLLLNDPELAPRPDLMERLLAYLVEVGEAVPTAEAALSRGDIEAFGNAVDLSHQNADENLHNQIEETNALQSIARELGAGAASAFGAGFGGSVWALIRDDRAREWADKWLDAYLAQFPENRECASVLITRAGEPAHRI